MRAARLPACRRPRVSEEVRRRRRAWRCRKEGCGVLLSFPTLSRHVGAGSSYVRDASPEALFVRSRYDSCEALVNRLLKVAVSAPDRPLRHLLVDRWYAELASGHDLFLAGTVGFARAASGTRRSFDRGGLVVVVTPAREGARPTSRRQELSHTRRNDPAYLPGDSQDAWRVTQPETPPFSARRPEIFNSVLGRAANRRIQTEFGMRRQAVYFRGEHLGTRLRLS